MLAISSSAGMGVGQQFNSLYVHVHMYSVYVHDCIVVVQCYPGLDFNFSLFYLFIYLFLMYDNDIVTKESKI